MGLFNINGLFKSMATFLSVVIGFVGITLVISSNEASIYLKIIGNVLVLGACFLLGFSAKKSIQEGTGFSKANAFMKIILMGFLLLFAGLVNFSM
jgi:hypothetical protein